ncbi:BhlA/UviB family holin-like peptide [Faecalimicrobium sp. JNUCC 81]
MENLSFDYLVSQGIFAVLFVWLLFDSKKDSKEREKEYQKTINSLANKISIVNEIKEDVNEIKIKLEKDGN